MTESTPIESEYVAVCCAVCGWKDALRKDFFDAGHRQIWCDQCDEETTAEAATERKMG